jgi:hypothetical protein
MNAISKGRSRAATSRITRGIGVAAVSAVLVAGLAGCMTGNVAGTAPIVQRNAVAPPAGVELGRPADRIAEQIERMRKGESATPKQTPTNPHPGVPADRLERLLQPQ